MRSSLAGQTMLVPAVIPSVSIETLKDKWSKLSYPELCYEVMRLYIAESEIPNADLKDIILNKSFSRFGHEGVVRVKEDVLEFWSQNFSSRLHGSYSMDLRWYSKISACRS